jgi:predicted enzyme related to lactoylglutathione lyase
MSQNRGRFIWYELLTSDTKAAQAFYGSVVGWTPKDSGMTDQTGMEYILFNAGETMIAGLMALTDEMRQRGVPPNWTGYVYVDDVDAATAQAKSLGGKAYMEPHDIPNVGRFAVIGDPDGAAIALFKPNGPDGPEPPMNTPGHVGWHELYANDGQKAFAFYAAMFGWERSTGMDMGPMGTYQIFARNGQDIGGMMNKPAEVPVPCWLYYFNVGDIDAAAERVKAGGGAVLNGPMEVPGGMWIVQCADPQGAMFALVGSRAK